MRVVKTEIEGLRIVEPRVHADERGLFAETWRLERYSGEGLPERFEQDNVSVSRRGVVRGLHFQNPTAQGKLVTALSGAIFDVAVDLRRDSSTFGRWIGAELSGSNLRQLWIPAGFAHGFQALEDDTVVAYKCTAPYAPADDRSLRWNDPAIEIRWPLPEAILSDKDRAAPLLSELPEEWLF
ncbi:dTDP-4-dehydrorhamnose 3,5-epimerase [soil metagenome]